MVISKKLKSLFLPLILITGIIIASGWLHYRELNRAEDPRIIDARKKMAEYNELMSENETDLALIILDSVEEIYTGVPGYADSYELGVVLNNRGSVYLIKAETDLINEREINEENLAKAKEFIEGSINIYSGWLDKINSMDRSEIRSMILPFFHESDPVFTGYDLNKIIEKRVDDIVASKIETKRRLSVSYTNLGIIYRYEGDIEKAVEQYEKALELWSENYVAKDNLSQLLGLPAQKRNLIQQMFFEDRI